MEDYNVVKTKLGIFFALIGCVALILFISDNNGKILCHDRNYSTFLVHVNVYLNLQKRYTSLSFYNHKGIVMDEMNTIVNSGRKIRKRNGKGGGSYKRDPSQQTNPKNHINNH